MYKLYYYPNNASLAPHFVLQEMGGEFELALVDRDSNWQKSAEYLALNPAGRIPTLIDGNNDNLVLFESPAICVYLAESNPQSGLIPPIGDPLRAKFHQWMMYLTNTLQADLMVYYYPLRHTTDSSHQEAIVAAQQVKIAQALALLDDELKDKTYLLGDKLSACDHFLLMLAIWADEISQPPLAFEHLGRYLRHLAKRDAVKAVCAKEGISLDDYL